ncbi:Gfo/Idh/MocA family oxidoreductase [Kibdelosporangium lantanae]
MLRIGVLGAARIAPAALVDPARSTSDVQVVAVAARDRDRAAAFAAKHGIPTFYDGYDKLIADPDIDAVYNPLPNGLHGRWTLSALDAGKHVLCEKPFTANADEAHVVADAAKASGLVVMEAFHYRYHPLFQRAVEIVRSGELGAISRIETTLCFPLPLFSDIRYNLGLAGGAQMDAGCYPVHMARSLAGSEPEVVSATAKLHKPGVDRAMKSHMVFGDVRATVTCSMWSTSLLKLTAKVFGSDGSMRIINPTSPQTGFHRMTVEVKGNKRVERFDKRPSYAYQLDAFAAAVRDSTPYPTTPEDAVANMAVIDAIYRAAGMEPRQPTATA